MWAQSNEAAKPQKHEQIAFERAQIRTRIKELESATAASGLTRQRTTTTIATTLVNNFGSCFAVPIENRFEALAEGYATTGDMSFTATDDNNNDSGNNNGVTVSMNVNQPVGGSPTATQQRHHPGKRPADDDPQDLGGFAGLQLEECISQRRHEHDLRPGEFVASAVSIQHGDASQDS